MTPGERRNVQPVLRVRLPQPPGSDFSTHLHGCLPPSVELIEGVADSTTADSVTADSATADSATADSAAADSAAADYDVLVAGRPTRAQLTASSRLHTLVIPYAGVPPQTIELLEEFPPLAVHNLHHNAAPAAELAVALMLAAAKRIVPMDAALRRHDWSPRYIADDAMLLTGKTAVIVGYGAIGRHIAAACRGLGMRVLATRRRLRADDPIDQVFAAERLDELLPRADVLHLCLPTTSSSRGLLGATELARLPRGALLVNVARGPVIDERALYDALLSGRIGAAGLDVWYSYPSSQADRCRTSPATLPFAGLDNVVLSPHRAGHCSDTERLRAEHLAEVLSAIAGGGMVPNRVDPALGY